MRIPLASLAAFYFGLTFSPVSGEALAETVTGIVKLRTTDTVVPGSRGFLRPIANPYVATTPVNIRSRFVVVLQGASKAPRETVEYNIVGESFEDYIMPVSVGSVLRIKNRGRNSPLLYTKTQPAADRKDQQQPNASDDNSDTVLWRKEALHPGAVRELNVTKPGYFTIRAQNTPHIVGRILVIERSYFSQVDSTGKYQMTGVAPGKYTAKIWYRDGWIPLETTLQVRASGTTWNPEITSLKTTAQ